MATYGVTDIGFSTKPFVKSGDDQGLDFLGFTMSEEDWEF